MQFRTMPKTGEKLSALGHGCMRLPMKGSSIDEVAAEEQIRLSIERGVNYFDTAVPYHNGASEPFLGKVLAKGLRSKVFIATKLPPWQVDSRKDMDRILDTQLEKLQTDHIDYYLIHSLNRASWDKMRDLGVREFLQDAKKDGRIRWSGFSFHGSREVFPEIVDAFAWDFCQIQYSYLDEQTQAGTAGLKYAAQKNLGIVVMEPLRGGNLARKLPPQVMKLIDGYPVKRSPADWALRWVWNHPEVTVVLSGMNSCEQIEENLRVAETALPNAMSLEEQALVGNVAETFRALKKIHCTNCQYCLPCPSGVDIPGCFEDYNNSQIFQDPSTSFQHLIRVGGVLGKPAHASLCTSCGACVSKCPQNLAIPSLLKDVARTFEGPGMWVKVRVFRFLLKVQKVWDVLRYGKRGKRK